MIEQKTHDFGAYIESEEKEIETLKKGCSDIEDLLLELDEGKMVDVISITISFIVALIIYASLGFVLYYKNLVEINSLSFYLLLAFGGVLVFLFSRNSKIIALKRRKSELNVLYAFKKMIKDKEVKLLQLKSEL